MKFDYLDCTFRDDGILHVQINRPPANSANEQLYDEVTALFTNPDRVAQDVRVIVLSGKGRHFCAGNDLDEFETMDPENGVERMWRARSAFYAVMECKVPVIAAMNGAAMGSGIGFAVSSDFIVATPDARFGLPELTVGVFGGARHLARIAPQPLVRRMFFTGEHLTAREFKDAGGCVFIAEGDLLEEAFAIAGRIARMSPTATRIAKQVLNRVEEMDLKPGYEYEQTFTIKASAHPDAKEALRAFREGRDPQFAGRTPEWTITL